MRASSLVPFVVIGLLAGVARAQTGAEAKAAADAAFDKGKQLQDAGHCDQAIEQFAKSQELDPQLGTQYNLALCYQEVGRLASAWAEFNELAAKDTNKKRKADAAKRAKAIAPRLTRMALTVAEPVDGLVITRDGVEVTALIDVETPVDPGVSTFEATAPGHAAWKMEVDLTAPGATVGIEVPPLEVIAEPVDHGDGGDADDGGGGDNMRRPPDEPPPPPRAHPGKGRKVLGLSLAGAGVIATGVGLVFGFQAKGLADDAKEACGGTLDPCDGDVLEAQSYIDDARGKANLSNLLVGGGVALAVVGVVVWLTAPSGEAPPADATAVVPLLVGDGLGLALDGAW